MNDFKKRLRLKVDCFSSDTHLRDLARVAYAECLFADFEGKEQSFIADSVLNNSLFLHATNLSDMKSMINRLRGILTADDFDKFIKKAIWQCIADDCYEKCKTIVDDYLSEKVEYDHRQFGIITSEKLDFIESISDKIAVHPFINMNYMFNKSGLEGHVRLLKLVNQKRLKLSIQGNWLTEESYAVLCTAAFMGYLDDFMSKEMIATIQAKALTEIVNRETHDDFKISTFNQYTDSDLMNIFCTATDFIGNNEQLIEGLCKINKLRNSSK